MLQSRHDRASSSSRDCSMIRDQNHISRKSTQFVSSSERRMPVGAQDAVKLTTSLSPSANICKAETEHRWSANPHSARPHNGNNDQCESTILRRYEKPSTGPLLRPFCQGQLKAGAKAGRWVVCVERVPMTRFPKIDHHHPFNLQRPARKGICPQKVMASQ